MSEDTSRNRKTPVGPTEKAEPKPAPRKGGQRSEAPNQSFETGLSTEGEDTPASLVGNHLPDSAYPNGNNLPADIEEDGHREPGKHRQPNRG